jgi:hypothetical protein
MMKNDLDRDMKDWLCTSKEEVTGEAEARSWDETIDNVWLRMAMCDHLLEFKTWRQDDPKPLRDISLAMTTRHLRILRKRLEKLMGKSAQKAGWDTDHKTVTLFRGASKTPLHTTLRMAGDGIQTHHTRVPRVKRVPISATNIIQAYLNMVDWRHIQMGSPQGDIKDWSTSPNFIQW